MMQIESVQDWIGRDVLGQDDKKVGKLTDVLFAGDEPVLAAVRSGRIAKRIHLVPLQDATATRDHLRVPYSADLVGSAPGESDRPVSEADLQGVEANFQVQLADGLSERLESWTERDARLAAAAAARQEADEAEARAAQLGDAARQADEEAVAARERAEQAHRDLDEAKATAAAARERADAAAAPAHP